MIPVDATEEMILNYSALQHQLDGWRRYRIEYGGCNEDCFMEQILYVPPRFDIDRLLDLFAEAQKPEKGSAKGKKVTHRE